MKKIKVLSVCLSLLLIFSLVGCGNQNDSSSGEASSGGDETSANEGIATPPGTENGYKIGLLFSLSGTTAPVDKCNYNGAMLAVEEINAAGGINGKPIIPIFEEYNSDPAKAAEKIKKLIMQDEVVATVGCLLSSTRQACKPIVEQNNSVLFYPIDYEGQEESENIVYMNILPNQQIDVFIPYIMENIGNRFYFIGSDFVYPTLMIKQSKELVKELGGEVVGEELVPLGHTDFASSLNKIKKANPDVVFSLVCGDSEIAFYKQYKNYGFDPKTLPICSPPTSEMTAKAVGAENIADNYSCRHYFNSLDTERNQAFVKAYNERFKDDTTINSTLISSYDSFYLLKMALEKIGDNGGKPLDGKTIVQAVRGLRFEDSPAGSLLIDPKNNHAWVKGKIAKADENGIFQVIWESPEPIEPKP